MGGRSSNGNRNTSSTTLHIAGRTLEKTDSFVFKDGNLYRNVSAGQFKESDRPYRLAGNYNLYVRSFPNAAQPYSKYYVADKKSGDVYQLEVIPRGTEREYIKSLVQELKERG